MTAKRNLHRPRLDREQWDFSTIATEELEACVEWEYSREVGEFRVGVEAMRKNENLRFDPECAGLRFRPVVVEIEEWPEKPFQHLPKCSRRGPFLKEFDVFQDGYEEWLSAGIAADPAALLRAILKYVETNGLPVSLKQKDLLNQIHPTETEQFSAFTIDWRRPDGTLLQYFNLWLKRNRPGDVAIEETRGKSPKRPWRAMLKELGALRLRRAGFTTAKAVIHTRDASTEKPLYEDNNSLWSRACTHAEERIQAFSSNLTFKKTF